MKILFSLFSISLIPIFCYLPGGQASAQITIEEKVEIDPQIIQSYNPTQTHTIQLDLQWDTPQYDVTIVGVVVPCQSAGAEWQNGGTISLTIDNAMAGLYRLQPRFNTPSGVTTNVTYQLYFDGSLIIEGTRAVPGGYHGTFPYFNIDYTPPLVSNFSFNLNNNVSCILTYTSMAILKYDDCSTGYSWNGNTEPVNLSFTSGGEFASFYNGNQQMIGDNFSGTFSEFQDIVIRQDSVYRGTADKYFIVQCEWGGMIKTDSVKLLIQTGDVIVVEPDGADDTLYTGEEISFEIYPNDFGGGCSISFPFELTYSAEILTGNEYGNLLEPYTGIPVQSFTGLWPTWWWARFDYVADGISPDVLDSVIIRVSTSDPSIPYTDFTLYIKPPPIYVYTEPEIVGADDTADVIIKHRLEDGTLVDFPPEQTFELAVLEGCVNGNFMVGTDINVYFAEAQQPIKFVTADSLDSDSGYVRLRVGTDVGGFMRPISNIKGEEEKQLSEEQRELVGNTGYTRSELRAGFEKMMEEKRAERLAIKNKTDADPPLEVPIIEACYLGESTFTLYWEGNAKYEDDKTIEILLGETKYFQAKYVGELLDKLVIEEVSGPELNGGLEIDVWHENPLTIVEGDKLGVYWETEKPVWNGNTKGEDLNPGLIRLVGRYYDLEDDKPFKVKLTAEIGPDIAEMEIVVKKPSKLGNDYSTSIDVFGETVKIDSICIERGNKLGIPPHFIKGHMKSETSSHYPFYPTYLYEPYTTQFNVMRYNSDNQFFIPDDATSFDPPVPNHSNVKDYHYPTSPTSVWQMIEDYSQLVYLTPPKGWRKYGDRIETGLSSQEDGVLYFYDVYSEPQRIYDKYKEDAYKKYNVLKNTDKEPQANNEARDSLVNYLKNKWNGGIVDGVKGLINIKAQTRIASSYGLLQMLYTSALNFDYPTENVPELLLETDNIKYAMKRLKNSLDRLIVREGNSANNWTLGLEESFKEYIWHLWNPGSSKYPAKVLGNVSLYTEIIE